MLFRRKPKLQPVEIPVFLFCREAGSVGNWVKNLPDVNGQTQARRLLEAAQEINHADCDHAQLKSLSASLRTSFIKARDNLYATDPEPKHVSSFVQLKQNFFTNFGEIFINAGMASFDEEDYETAKLFLPLASECLTESIIASLELYRPPQPNSWSRLHDLHIHLATRSEDYELIKDVNLHYFRVVMLACLQTAQLNYESIQVLKELAHEQSSNIKLVPSLDEKSTHQIAVGRDQPPEKCIDANPEKSLPGDKLYIDMRELSGIQEDPRCSTILRLHIARVLEFKLYQKDKRTQSIEALKICLTIENLHSVLSGNLFDQFLKDCVTNSRIKNQEGSDEVDAEIWNTVYDGNWDTIENGEELDTLEFKNLTSQDIEKNNAIPNPDNKGKAMALNKSDSGYLIACEAKITNAETGTLIGLQPKADQKWIVASIRWQKNEIQFNKFGVEKIGSNPIPAGVKILRSTSKTDYCPALRLSALPEDNFEGENSAAPKNRHRDTLEENETIAVIPALEMRDKSPVLYIDSHGERRGIIKEIIEENSGFLICLIRFAN